MTGEPFRLTLYEIRFHRKVGFRQQQGLFVIPTHSEKGGEPTQRGRAGQPAASCGQTDAKIDMNWTKY